MSPDVHFRQILRDLQVGSDAAAQEIFDRYAVRLIHLARSRLQRRMLSKLDPEDVVQSVFRSFFRRYRLGKYRCASWKHLWDLLVVITLHKCHNQRKYFRAARRDITREASLSSGGWSTGAAPTPTPEQAAVLADLIERLMEPLDRDDQIILQLHLQEFTIAQIADCVGLSQRTVHRALAGIRRQAHRLFATDTPPSYFAPSPTDADSRER